jgi:mRNA-degrading endonuclease toxin of MazEF toxin-antitoxin module
MDAGEIYLADLNEELRRKVVVVSSERFAQASHRVMIVPEISGPDPIGFPWRVASADAVFAVELLQSLDADRLLERVGRVTPKAMVQIRSVLRQVM